jgi:hypothetical protein
MIWLALLAFSTGLQAQEQEPGEQLLVFRNTGVIDLLYTNEVDSILTNDTTQVFYAKDTVLVVPLAELDSVAVGNRNVRVLNAQVHELTTEHDLPWLIRTEGNHLYFRLDTPDDVLPQEGEKLFYGDRHDLLPIGLCARVVKVTQGNVEQDVEVEPIELHEIFDRFFFAGRVQMGALPENVASRQAKRTDTHEMKVIPIEGALEVVDYGEVNAKCELTVIGDFVVDVWAHYYHAHIKGEFDGEVGAKLKCDANTECHPTIPLLTIPFPAVAGVLYPSVYVNLFTDFNAELNLNFAARRVYRFEYDWTRKDGEQHGEALQPTEGEAVDDEAQADITLDGKLHMGVQAGLGLNLIGNRVGFRFDAKLGPCFEGLLGIGILGRMRNYESGLWHKAELNSSIKLAIGLSYLTHDLFYVFGNEVITPITTLEFDLFKQTLHLFPEYEQTRAVAQMQKEAGEQMTSISTATAVEELPLTDLETGFEIVNPQGEVVDSVFVGTIEAAPRDATESQTFDTKMVLPPTIKLEDLDGYTMRPVFHYAGYTVSAAPVGVKKGVLLQPYSSTQGNGAMTFISSGPFLASASDDSTHYQLGSWLPVPLKHNVYKQGKDAGIIVGTLIDVQHAILLAGTWLGEIEDEEVTLVFNDDGATGLYNGSQFSYSLNTPQSGDLLLVFDEEDVVKLFRVVSITEYELILVDKRDVNHTVLRLVREPSAPILSN